MAKKIMVLSAVFFVFLSPLFAQTANTPIIDLRPEFGSIRDQGGLGFCYAYATADLLSYWLNNSAGFKGTERDTRKKENMVSALALALSFNRETVKFFRKDLQQKGLSYSEKAEKKAKEKLDNAENNFLETNEYAVIAKGKLGEIGKKFKSKDTLYAVSTSRLVSISEYNELSSEMMSAMWENKEYQHAFNEYWDLKFFKDVSKRGTAEKEGGYLNPSVDFSSTGICFEGEVNSNGGSYVKGADKSTVAEVVKYTAKDFLDQIYLVCSNKENKTSEDDLAKKANLIFSNAKKRIIDKLVKKAHKEDTFDPISKLLKKACIFSRKLAKNVPVIKTCSNIPTTFDSCGEKQTMFDILETQLKNKKPVYVSYDSSVFDIGLDMIADLQYSHASVIVGMYKDTNKTEYILRNSWGASSCEENYKSYYSPTPEEKILVKEYESKINDNCVCAGDIDSCVKKYMNELEQRRAELSQKVVKPFRCENGYYVIQKEALQKVTDYVAWLEDPSKSK